MANPNRTVANWRNSRPTFEMVSQTSFRSRSEAEDSANAIKATKEFDRVSVSSLKVGPRDKHQRVFLVRCYRKL
jgi:glutamate synthase domain-containing protein 2